MVRDAIEHQRDDEALRELANLRNRADSLVYSTRKSMQKLGDKVTTEERGRIEGAIQALESAMKSDDRIKIEAAIDALSRTSGDMAERIYRQ
jgi:molecular chaperone DnaK